MIALNYVKITSELYGIEPYFILSDISGSDDGAVQITVSDTPHAVLTVNGKRYKLISGKAVIPVSELPCGKLETAIVIGGTSYKASSFLNEGGKILCESADALELLILKNSLIAAGERMACIEKKLEALEGMLKPHDLFNFN